MANLTYSSGSGAPLPPQGGNSGEFLSTDGTIASWVPLAGGGDMSVAIFDPNAVGGDAFLLSNKNGTPNRIIYTDASGDVQELAFGAAGEVLKSNGAAAAPSWQTDGGGGTSLIDSNPADLTSSGPTSAFTTAVQTTVPIISMTLNAARQLVETDAGNTALAEGSMYVGLEAKNIGETLQVAEAGSYVRDDNFNTAFPTVNAPVYLNKGGGWTQDISAFVTGDVIRIVGMFQGNGTVRFDPRTPYRKE